MSLKDKLESLAIVLNDGASINFPGDPKFYSNTIRWSEHAAPQPGAAINVATEADVQKTVCGILLKYRNFELLGFFEMGEWRELIQLLTSARSNGLSKTASNSLLKLVDMDGQYHGISEILGFSSTCES